MGFKILVDGVNVHEVDIDPRLVTGVSLRSAAGEAGISGSPFSGAGNDYVNLVLVVQQATALPVVEDDARLAAQESDQEEVLTYNENAQREEALKQVNEDFAAKAAESDEDLSAELGEAQAAAMSPETRNAVDGPDPSQEHPETQPETPPEEETTTETTPETADMTL